MVSGFFEVSLGESFVLQIGYYRLFGFLAALYLMIHVFRFMNLYKINNMWKVTLIAAAVAFFFVGSRFLYVLLYLPEVLKEPSLVFQLGFRNFTLFGGLIFVTLFWWFYTKKADFSFAASTDYLVPHLGISIFIMRIGCYLNGCCHGKVTDVPWGVTVPLFSPAHLAQIIEVRDVFSLAPKTVHPTQVYEMIAALAAAMVAFLVNRKKLKAGMTAAVFALVLSTGRLIVFNFRVFPVAGEVSNFFRGPLIYGAIIILSSWWIIKNRRQTF